MIECAVEPGTSRRNKTGSWRTFKPVVKQELCSKCRICYTYCPDNAICELESGYFEVDYDYCKGCGICANECPKTAIVMVLEEK